MRLSPHFDSAEFDCHDGTACPAHAYPDLEHLCRRYLEPLRRLYGPVTIISGYRTPEHNRAVRGAPGSFHVYKSGRWGAAADVVCASGRPARWYATLASLDPGGLGSYPEHVHVDNRNGHARW